jgi:hypothetical protein
VKAEINEKNNGNINSTMQEAMGNEQAVTIGKRQLATSKRLLAEF